MRKESIHARGVKVSYLASGDGTKTLILVHGLFCTPYYFQGLMEALPPSYRVIATDHFVDSDRPWGGWNVSGFADEMRDLADALGAEKVILGGHSLGGIIAQLFALRYQERLEKLLLLGTGATLKGHGKYEEFCETVRKGLRPGDYPTIISAFFSQKPPAQEFNSYVDHVLKAQPEALGEALLTAINYDFVSQLPYITVPTLICHGTLDTGRKMEHAHQLKAGIPNSKLCLYEAGHAMMIEKREQFNQDVISFLEA